MSSNFYPDALSIGEACKDKDFLIEGTLSIRDNTIVLKWNDRRVRLYRDASLRLYSLRATSNERLVRQLNITDASLLEVGDKGFEIQTRSTGELAVEAPSAGLAAVWLAELYHMIYSVKGGVAFGLSLTAVMLGQVGAGGQPFVPRLVADCVWRVEQALAAGELTPGSLRSNGAAASVRRYRLAYQRGDRVRPLEIVPNDAMSLMRSYLGELPEPVMSPEARSELLALCRSGESDSTYGPSELNHHLTSLLLERVPQLEARNLLRFICQHIHRLLTAGMDTESSLIGQFATSLLMERGSKIHVGQRQGDNTPSDCCELLGILVRHFDDIFVDKTLPMEPIRPALRGATLMSPRHATAATKDMEKLDSESNLAAIPAQLLQLYHRRVQQVDDLGFAIAKLKSLMQSCPTNCCTNSEAGHHLPEGEANCDHCEPAKVVRATLTRLLNGHLKDFDALAARNSELTEQLKAELFG